MYSESTSSSYIVEQAGLTGSEQIRSLFQPDTFLSAQYFDDRRIRTSLEPEKRLLLAVLEDAIDCFRENHSARCGKSKQLFDEAQDWILDASDWVFGFENICGALGFNPEYMREGLVRWRQKQLSKDHSAPLTFPLHDGPHQEAQT
jgi:hypothetical protein